MLHRILTLVLLAATATAPVLGQEPSPPAGNIEDSDPSALPTVEDVKAQFAAAFPQECAWALGSPDLLEPVVDAISYRYASDEADDPDRLMTLYTFPCGGGAYNVSQVYYLVNEYGEMLPLEFAEPNLAIAYKDDKSDKKVRSIAIDGWTASQLLTNSFYDAASNSITAAPKWRGLGDASSLAIYELVEDRFVLKRYDVDASYDGKINPQTVIDLQATN